MSEDAHPLPDRDLDTVDEFRHRVGGISRTKAYELFKTEVRTVKIGSRTYVPRSERESFLARLLEHSSAPNPEAA